MKLLRGLLAAMLLLGGVGTSTRWFGLLMIRADRSVDMYNDTIN